MDYKEKYEMALEGIQEILGSGEDSIKMSRLQLRLQGIFPELKENGDSEDDKIRKSIIEFVKQNKSFHYLLGVSKEDALAWLEKQGGQKPAEWSKEDERNFDIIYGIIYNSCNAEDARRLIEWLKSLKDRVQPQPKQEWNEEDEKKRSLLIRILEVNHPNGYFKVNPANTLNMEAMHVEELVDWLKSLRPQNRCTYNPYKEVVESIAEMCKKYEDANLDSLKDFYSNVKVKCKDAKEYDSLFPQSTWKPSEEQIMGIDCDIKTL